MDRVETIGRYRVLNLVGGGGMATVYRAEHPILKQTVAVKVLHPHLATDAGFLARFRQEAEAVATLRHPNIVRWLDFDTDGDTCFMVLEYVDGPTLEARLRELGAHGRHLSPNDVLALLRPLAAALDYAHAKGFVHRDMKPANILLTSAGEPVITDFGIARFLDQTGITLTGTVLGSAYYMSPEQIEGRPADGRSDIYSLGIILFQALTGRVPFDGENTVVIMAKHLQEPVPAARDLDSSLPPAIDVVLRRVLAKDREDRYASGADLLQDFEKAVLGPTEVATRPAPTRIEIPPVIAQPPPSAPAETPSSPTPAPAARTRLESPPLPRPEQGSVPPIPPAPAPIKKPEPSAGGRPRGHGRTLIIVLLLLVVVGALAFVALRPKGGVTASTTVSTAVARSTGGATTTAAPSTTSAAVASAYAIGDTGPAGGLIFYDRGNNSGGWRYLEAAPASTEWVEREWGAYEVDIPGAEGTAVGTGKQNTAAAVVAEGIGSTYPAQLCDGLTSGGFSDWFLPSKDELNLMYTNLHSQGVGGFQPDAYWSSSEGSAYAVWSQYFDGGYQSSNDLKVYAYRVRAARAF